MFKLAFNNTKGSYCRNMARNNLIPGVSCPDRKYQIAPIGPQVSHLVRGQCCAKAGEMSCTTKCNTGIVLS